MTERGLDRRGMLAALAAGAAAACWARRAQAEDEATGQALETGPPAALGPHVARWWKEAGELRVQCELCPKRCRVADKERGTCGVRENRGGTYHSLVYARPCSVHVDPIEKKPFFHVLPGKTALSLGLPGCNLQCKFCQNWEISQVRPEQVRTFSATPESIVALAKEQGAPTVACTYSEPTVWSEYVFDLATSARKAGLRALMVSNGFIQPEPMTDLISVLGAVKVDLKAYSEKFYRDTCRGKLAPVLDTLRLLRKKNLWTEIVVLVIPGLNDDESEVRGLARFVKTDLGPDVPVHFTRFHPSYRLQNVPATPVKTLTRLHEIARGEGLNFVYVGNVPGHPGNNTVCPGCGKVVIRRVDMAVVKMDLKAGACAHCGRAIPGIWT
jgi:pyruvate formate lyase activating enzyme